MSKAKSVSAQMDMALEEVTENVREATTEAGKTTARDVAKQLRATSPRQEHGEHAGRYAKGWTYKAGEMEAIVYNRTDWQLTHLLADGHDVYNQYGGPYEGRASGDSHIADAEEFGITEYPLRISRGLK